MGKVTTALSRSDVRTLASLVTSEVDKVTEANKNLGFSNPGYFYYLLDLRKKLRSITLEEKSRVESASEDWEELFQWVL